MKVPETPEEEDALREKFRASVQDERVGCGRSVLLASPPRTEVVTVVGLDSKLIVTGAWVRVDIFVSASEVGSDV